MRKDLNRLPYQQVVVPIFPEVNTEESIRFAGMLKTEVHLLGLLPVPEEEALSMVVGKASDFRTRLQNLYSHSVTDLRIVVRVGVDVLDDLCAYTEEFPDSLLVLEYPVHFDSFKRLPFDLLETLCCDVVIVRGQWKEPLEKITLPLRGGRYAEMALRLARQMPHRKLSVVHFISPMSQEMDEAPFRGLMRVLPNMPDVSYTQSISLDLGESILQESGKADALIIGATIRSLERQGTTESVLEKVLQKSVCPVAAIKMAEKPARMPAASPELWTGTDGALQGAHAISLLVDRWFAQNTYHSREFDDLEGLVKLKEDQEITISLVLPAFNEEDTVGNVIRTVKTALMDDFPLLDEIVLMDSMSTDRTREIAADLGIPVFIHQEVLPKYGSRKGKGEALWKSLFVTQGDILVWLDTDIVNVHPRFVYGILGPLLEDRSVQYVKGFYRRPLRVGNQMLAGGGGRVTELTARPLINLFYPELSGVVQPLSGEYGGRRSALEQLHFFSGYGVEIGMLIEVFEKFGISSIAQVDLLKRVHHNQSLEDLSKMSFVILQAFMQRLEKRSQVSILEDVNRTMKLVRYDRKGYYLGVEEVPEYERPPMIQIAEYCAVHATKN